MTTIASPSLALPVARQHYLRTILGNLLRRPSGLIGVIILVTHLVIAILSPWIVPYDFAAQDSNLIMASPSLAHPFGTDSLGRDVLSRTLLGGRLALTVTIVGTLLAMGWGGFVGVWLGLLGGRVDEITMRVVDAFLAIPALLLLLLIISTLGSQMHVLILILGFFFGIAPIRVVRAATLEFVAQDFILAARARGESKWTIMRQELLPNIMDILLVEGAMRWSWMLLSFSSLSFLGFGVVPPTPDWGLMIATNRSIMAVAPWATLYPLAALTSLIIGINLAADAFAKAVGSDRTQGAPV